MALPKHQSFYLLGGCMAVAGLIVATVLLFQWMAAEKFRNHGTVSHARIVSKNSSIRYKTGNVSEFRVLLDTENERPSEIGDIPRFDFTATTVPVSAEMFAAKSVGDRIGVIYLKAPDLETRTLDSLENFRWRISASFSAALLLLGGFFFKLGGRSAPPP